MQNELQIVADLALIMWVCVFVIDASGFRDTVLALASRILGGPVKSLKPLTCSLCMTWWLGLAYLLVTRSFSIGGVAMVAAVALISQPVASLVGALLDFINRIINKIQ